jgi:hypothetical protein
MKDVSYVAFNTSLVNNLINIVGGHAGLQGTGRNIQNLTSQTADYTHTLLLLLVQNLNLMLAP